MFVLRYRTDLDRAQQARLIQCPLRLGDEEAHAIRLSVYRGGAPFDMTGLAIQGHMKRGDGSGTEAFEGSALGNVAAVVLPAACYAVPGPGSLVLRALKDGDVITLAVFSVIVKS